MSVRINLLPIRAAKRQSSAKQELFISAGLVFLTLIGVYLWSGSLDSEIADVQADVNRLNTDLAGLKKDRARVQEFDKKNKVLIGKRNAIRKLQAQRSGPAKLLDDLARVLTQENKVWLTELKEKNGKMVLKGGAMENVNISDFQLALRNNSPFFKGLEKPEALQKVERTETGGISHLKWEIQCIADYSAGGI